MISKTIQKIALCDLSLESLDNFKIPIVITGLLGKDTEWNLDYLCETISDHRFLFRHYGQQRYQQDKQKWQSIGSGVEVREMLFSEYAQMLRNGQAKAEDIYLAKADLKDTPLSQSHSLQALGSKLNLTPVTDYRMYMGHGGHTASLHYDILHGTLCQLYGQKKVILFPPRVTPFLYPFPIWVHLTHGMKLRCCYSQVDLETKDLTKFPDLNLALREQKTVTLNAGEVLFIPVGWWHEISTLDTNEISCSVSRFWQVSAQAEGYLSWQRWRPVLGNILALPHQTQRMIKQFLKQPTWATIREILYRI
ncbi:transcription factor jumonji jmjC domain-containing protein [Halothece sp. PCC 7418]|uniref:cupin-like domain-containing protein n=1 Tax=Halothece sp. (strain PCC 7418) TaxID=65093 RepID=UPI0002A06CCF|nr:cupin-like domain-containing protein [Halothece sp. PCC 7418]AFZ45942.1 transcription factor jumonji jmjC domain-containing protein [Halothece sp. PCC 7418]